MNSLRKTVFSLALSACIAPALSADYMQDAITKLTDTGFPPPSGYIIDWAQPGSLPPGMLGVTPPSLPGGEAVIGLNPLLVYGFFLNDSSPQTGCDVVAALLYHEYHHTPDYGWPSSNGEPGWGNGICAHQEIYNVTNAYICLLVYVAKEEGNSTRELCMLANTLLDVYNGGVRLYNAKCPPPTITRLFLCNDC